MTELKWLTAGIIRIEQRTPRIKSFFFQLPEQQQHKPGQHFDVRLTAPDGYQAVRSYSIASAPDQDGIIELAIDRLDGGEVSNFFHDVAAIGDEIELRGPLGGHFVWRPQDGGPVLLIGGGSGVVPFMSMIRAWFAQKSEVPLALLFSASSLEQAPFFSELSRIAAERPQFLLELTLTREAPSKSGHYGRRIDATMVRAVADQLGSAPVMVFICGSNGFANTAVDSVEAVLGGVAVRTERYGG